MKKFNLCLIGKNGAYKAYLSAVHFTYYYYYSRVMENVCFHLKESLKQNSNYDYYYFKIHIFVKF